MSKVILITGANRGIGFCIAQGIAQCLEDCCILMGARDLSAAEDAISKLRHLQATFEPIELDVTSDESIKACLEHIKTNHGRLDVLINNAAIASPNPQPSSSSDPSSFRKTYTSILSTNLTSPAQLTTLSLPLLRSSPLPRVINISSARASLHMITSGTLPPTACIPYSVSKVALNALTLELARAHPEVEFCVASPGHCRTAFNGFRGKKDPVEGARVVVELVVKEERGEGVGFWEWEEGALRSVPW